MEISRETLRAYKAGLTKKNIPGSPWWIAAALRCWDDNHFKLIAGTSGGIYLARFWLTEPKRNNEGLYLSDNSVLLHHFLDKDPDRHIHNHPQPFTSQILTGGYVEGVEDDTNTYVMGDINRIGRDHYHRVEHIHGDTWSLVNTGPREGDWGFKVDGVHVPHKEYLAL